MSTATETLSQQLIKEMDRLGKTATRSFERTDALLAQIGLTRQSLGSYLSHCKRQLPEESQTKLLEWDRERQILLEKELAIAASPVPKRSHRRLRVGPLERI